MEQTRSLRAPDIAQPGVRYIFSIERLSQFMPNTFNNIPLGAVAVEVLDDVLDQCDKVISKIFPKSQHSMKTFKRYDGWRVLVEIKFSKRDIQLCKVYNVPIEDIIVRA